MHKLLKVPDNKFLFYLWIYIAILLTLLLSGCSDGGNVRFRAKYISTRGIVNKQIYLIYADNSFKAGDTITADSWSAGDYILLERVK